LDVIGKVEHAAQSQNRITSGLELQFHVSIAAYAEVYFRVIDGKND
jgi:hypothetical protein